MIRYLKKQSSRHNPTLLLKQGLWLVAFVSTNLISAQPERIRSVEGITEYRLDNGLQVLLFPDQSKDTITVNITYHVGSKHENYGETGMAHLLEHLVFKGTPRHPNIAKELSDHGAQANGTTWLERTNYYETFKATDENLNWALDMEADRMVNSFIAQEDLDSEMTVVRNEFERGENSPGRILRQQITSAAYQWHNYGNSTIGARSDIENVEIENLQAFYRKYYQPDNATLIVAGKIDEEKTLGLVEKYFGVIPRPERTLPDFYTKDPAQDGERTVTVRRVGDEQIVAAAYHIPSGLHSDFPALEVLSQILGDTPSGRLHKELVENDLATSVWAWANQQRDSSLFMVNANADMDTDLDATKMALMEVTEKIDSNSITQEEVDRAKRQLLKDIELAFNSSQRISLQLSEWISMGDWRMFFLNRDRIEQVELADAQRVAEKYFVSSNRTLGRFIPTDDPIRAEIPDTPKVAELLKDYQGREAIAQGESFDATPENIEDRVIRIEEGTVKIALLPVKTRGHAVHLDLRLGIGNESALEGKREIGALTASMLDRGSESKTRQEIQDALDILKAQGGISGSGSAVRASFETTKENLPDLIRLVHEVVTTPSFPQKEFDMLKTQRLARLESQLSDPQALAFRRASTSFNRYPKNHYLHTPSIEEEMQLIEKVKVEDLKNFYKETYGAENMQIAIVGAFEAEEVTDVVVDLFSSWKPKESFARIKNEFKTVSRISDTIETPDKKNSVFIAGINFEMTQSHPDAPAMQLVAHMLGGGFINSRLASRIRQQDGLSYGVGAWTRIPSKHATNATFNAYAISAPENTEKVHTAFQEEMLRAFDDGFEEQELADAKNGFLDRRKVNLSNYGSLANRVRTDLDVERDMTWERDFITKVEALSVEEVNRVMREHLHPDKMTIIKAGDFANLDKDN